MWKGVGAIDNAMRYGYAVVSVETKKSFLVRLSFTVTQIVVGACIVNWPVCRIQHTDKPKADYMQYGET